MTDRFLQAMRRVSGTVTVVTITLPDGTRRGITATAFTSLSADPPSVLACVNRQTQVGKTLQCVDRFCVNVLAAPHQPVAEVFAGRGGLSGEERFAHGEWTIAATGAPVLDGALAAFDCQLETIIEHATHFILIGRVAETMLSETDADPLLYCDGRFTTTVRPEALRACA